MASSRIARFVSEVAPPQFVSLMRHRTTKMLDTISEDEREVSLIEREAKTAALRSSLPSAPSHPATSGNSMYFFEQTQRKFPMASSRIGRFVSEVAPPQFVSLMRHRTTKMLDTISEDEREVSLIEREAKTTALSSSRSSAPPPSHQATSGTSMHFFERTQRKFSVVFGN
ncbi:hypothetical protein Ccrd_008609 [Cynara cardunculus var. scolymus]|uniref:Uncharacterized protein n=1 Tax=Cynara cardunculus var. scolymus TaxID=59895 RepID=A0A103XEX2_CYNCS|nr:hypothetical protein Ccrd_008609 [Cynara cardunculus var. scolymus]